MFDERGNITRTWSLYFDSLAPYLPNQINVQDYGAAGDGKTDDGPSVRIASAVAIALNATLLFPYTAAGYLLSSLDPATYVANGVTVSGPTSGYRNVVTFRPTNAGNRFRLIGEGALLIFDFPAHEPYPGYELHGLVFDGTVGSFERTGWEGISFVSKNGPWSLRANVFLQGACDVGTCNVSGTAITRLTGPAFTASMMGRCVLTGAQLSDTFEQGNVHMLGGRVNVAGDGVTVSLVSGPGFKSSLSGTIVTIGGQSPVVSSVTSSSVLTLATAVPQQYYSIMTSRILYLPHGAGSASASVTFPISSGDTPDNSWVGQSFTSGATKRTVTAISGSTITLDSAVTLAAASFTIGFRPFDATIANRTVAVYWDSFTVASVDASGYFLTLSTTPFFGDGSYINSITVFQLFPGYKVTAVSDGNHLTTNAPAGTATGAPWSFTRPSLGIVDAHKCSYTNAVNGILGGGYKVLNISHSQFYMDAGFNEPYAPYTGFNLNNDHQISWGEKVIVSDCYSRGGDGFSFVMGQVQISNCRVEENVYEAHQLLLDIHQGRGTPAKIRTNSSISGGTIDCTPPAGGSAKQSYGIRCDASDVTICGVDIFGTPIAVLCNGTYRPVISGRVERVKVTGCKITLPDSYESGVAMDTVFGAFIGLGVSDCVASDCDIFIPGSTNGATKYDVISIGSNSRSPVFRNIRIKQDGKYGGVQTRGFHAQQSGGQMHLQGCTVEGANIGLHLGNDGDPTDQVSVLVQQFTPLNCDANSAGNLASAAFDQQVVLFTPSAVGWYRIYRGYGEAGLTLQILRAGSTTHFSDTVFHVQRPGYQATPTAFSFTQLRHSSYAPVVTKARAQQDQANAGYITVDIYIPDISDPTAFPIGIALLNNPQSGAGLFDPPVQSLTLAANATAGDATFQVASLNGVQPGEIMQVGAELVRIDAAFTSPLRVNVERGYNGTMAASHLSGLTLSIISGDDASVFQFVSGFKSSSLSLAGTLQTVQGQSDKDGQKTVIGSTAGTSSLLEIASPSNNSTYVSMRNNTAPVASAALATAASAGNTNITLGAVTGGLPSTPFVAIVDGEEVLVSAVVGPTWTISALTLAHDQGSQAQAFLCRGWRSHSDNGTPPTFTMESQNADGTWTIRFYFEATGKLTTTGALSVGGALSVFGNTFASFTALANAIVAAGDYTGNAPLVATIAAKVGHGAALTGTANPTTNAVTGTVT